MKFWAIQAFYCISGIGFFIQDLFDRVPQGDAMIRAFIWPYAQKDRIAILYRYHDGLFQQRHVLDYGAVLIRLVRSGFNRI